MTKHLITKMYKCVGFHESARFFQNLLHFRILLFCSMSNAFCHLDFIKTEMLLLQLCNECGIWVAMPVKNKRFKG